MKRFRGWTTRRHVRNRSLLAIGVILLICAIESAPLPNWNVPYTQFPLTKALVPQSTSLFSINVTNLVTFPPTGAKNLSSYEDLPFSDCSNPPPEIAVKCYYFTGFVELYGKGGLSVDNPINLNVTINVPPNFTSIAEISAITFIPTAVLSPNFSINSTYGIPQNVHIHLHEKKQSFIPGWTTWTGTSRVVYSLSGTFGGKMLTSVRGSPYPPINGNVTGDIQVGSSSVTAQSFTGEATISLAFIAAALALFTLRSRPPETIAQSSQLPSSPASRPTVPNRQKFRR